jgi:hypothetical protein
MLNNFVTTKVYIFIAQNANLRYCSMVFPDVPKSYSQFFQTRISIVPNKLLAAISSSYLHSFTPCWFLTILLIVFINTSGSFYPDAGVIKAVILGLFSQYTIFIGSCQLQINSLLASFHDSLFFITS